LAEAVAMERLKQWWFELDVACLSLLTPSVVLVVWEACAVSCSFLNRMILSPNGMNFNYIIFLSLWQALFVLICLTPVVLCRLAPASWEQLKRNFFGISMLALLWVLSALCTSGAQAFLGSSAIEEIKCCMPFPTMLLSVIFERDRQGVTMTYPRSIVGAVFVLVAGAVMVVYDTSTTSALGFFLDIAATCMTACYYVAAGVLLKTSSGGLNPLNLAWYVAVVAIPLLLICFAFSTEPHTVFSTIGHNPDDLWWLTLSALAALVISLLSYVFVVCTSALTVSVSEALKRVIMVLVSVGLTHSASVAVNAVGLGLFVPGCIAYAYFVFLRRFEAPREPPQLEAGMGLAMKGKSEATNLLNEEAPSSATCCVLQ